MVVSKTFEGTNADALQEYLQAINPGVQVRVAAGAELFKVSSYLVQSGGLKAWRSKYACRVDVHWDRPESALVLGIPTTGSMTCGEHRVTAGNMLAFQAAEMNGLAFSPDTQTDNFWVPTETLDARLAQLLDRPLRNPVGFEPVIGTREGGGAAVSAVLRGLLWAGSDATTLPSTSSVEALSTALLDLVLESLPHNYTDALRRPVAQASPRQVRRAMAYIQDHPMPVKTTDELAAICGVSVRSLQYAFRSFVGMAPAEYWRKVRLDHAIEQLRLNPMDSESRVANDWGFTNITRFRALAAQR